MKILIGGRSGSGKSALCAELVSLGYQAFDGDHVPGLCSWIDAKTGTRAHPDYTKPIHKTDFLWTWNETVLRDLLDRPSDVFLCGSADNDLELYDLFDRVFVLTLSPDTQRRRILDRTAHNYGKQPGMVEYIVNEQADFVERAAALGATPIDAEPSPAEIIRTILGHTHEH